MPRRAVTTDLDRVLARLRAANPVPPSFAHVLNLDVDALAQLIADPDVDVGDVKSVEPTKRRKRRPTIASVTRQAARANVSIAHVDLDADGYVTRVVFGRAPSEEAEPHNEWDEPEAVH